MNYLSIDIGGTAIKVALMDCDGNILNKYSINTPQMALEDFCQQIISCIEPVKEEIKGVALSVPGRIDSNEGKIIVGGSLSYLNGFCIKEFIEEKFNLPTIAENDAKAAVLCEMWRGDLKDYSEGIVLVLGTAVGGGIVLDGKIRRGINFQAGEFSYQLVKVQNGYNYLGRHLSAVRMIKEMSSRLGLDDSSDGREIFKYIKNKDKRIYSIFKDYCYQVALLINNLQVTFDIEQFIIGGGISQQPLLIETIKEQLKNIRNEYNLIEIAFKFPIIKASKFYNDANLYGALYQLLKILGQN